MRALFIGALLALTSHEPIPEHQSGPQEPRQESKQNRPKPAVPPVVTTQPNQPTAAVKESPVKKTEGTWHKAFSPESWPNWALVLVGIGAIWAALRTLGVIRRQTAATEEAARASRVSADALINAERAWVVAELRPTSRQGKDGRLYHEEGVPFTTEEVLAGKHLVYLLRLTNKGRTPAHILSFEMRYSCLLEGIKDLPETAGDIVESREYEVLLDPGPPIEITEPKVHLNNYMNESWDEICELKKTAVFHGLVRYRHMFSTDDCYSYYCYVYTPSRNRLTSVGRHTRYT